MTEEEYKKNILENIKKIVEELPDEKRNLVDTMHHEFYGQAYKSVIPFYLYVMPEVRIALAYKMINNLTNVLYDDVEKFMEKEEDCEPNS